MSNTKVNAALDRRAALRFGAVGAAATAATAVTVVTASDAQAAAGQAVLQGRVNSPGATDTSIIAPTAGIAFTVKNTGTGAAGYFFAAKGNGFAGGTAAGNKVGLSTANTGPASSGAAMGAVGINNTGVQASTTNSDRFAVTAINFGTTGAFDGDGGGLYAESGANSPGIVAIAPEGIPGVVSVGDLILSEGHEVVITASTVVFGVTSDDGPEVTFSRTVQLSAAGAATVDLTGPSTDSVDLSRPCPSCRPTRDRCPTCGSP